MPRKTNKLGLLSIDNMLDPEPQQPKQRVRPLIVVSLVFIIVVIAFVVWVLVTMYTLAEFLGLLLGLAIAALLVLALSVVLDG